MILDDLSYVRRDHAETSALFELIVVRYERKSLAITANQPFSGWDKVFPEAAMTLAAVDRLMHHSTIFELSVESYRRRAKIVYAYQWFSRVAPTAVATHVSRTTVRRLPNRPA